MKLFKNAPPPPPPAPPSEVSGLNELCQLRGYHSIVLRQHCASPPLEDPGVELERSPGAVDRSRPYEPPPGLHVAPNGRFRVSSARPAPGSGLHEAGIAELPEKSAEEGVDEMSPDVGRAMANVASLGRYVVCETGDASAAARFFRKWETTHLDLPCLPEGSLPVGCKRDLERADTSSTLMDTDRYRTMVQGASMGLSAVRIKVITPSGMLLSVELPTGLQATVATLLSLAIEKERERLPSEHEDDELAGETWLEFRGSQLSKGRTVEEVGLYHGAVVSLKRDGAVRVEETELVDEEDTGDVGDCYVDFFDAPRYIPVTVDTREVQAAAGSAVKAAVGAQRPKGRLGRWEVEASRSGWRQPGDNFLTEEPDISTEGMEEGEEEEEGAGVEPLASNFELGTPVAKYIDQQTKRIVLKDAAGQCAALYADGVVPLRDHPMRQWLIDFYLHHAPEKVGDVDRILWNAEGREDEVRRLCVAKYGEGGVEPYEDYCAKHREKEGFEPGTPVEEYRDEETGCRVTCDAEGKFAVWGDEGADPVPLARSPMRVWLVDFFKCHSPERVGEVDRLLWEYAWREETLRNELMAQHGDTPPYTRYVAEHAAARSHSVPLTPTQEASRRRGSWVEVVEKGSGKRHYYHEGTSATRTTPTGTPFDPNAEQTPPRENTPQTRTPVSPLTSTRSGTDFSLYTSTLIDT